MKFLIIASYPPSILGFRGALIKAIEKIGFQIHITSPEFKNFPEELHALKALGYYVYDIPMQRTGTNPIADAKTLFAFYRLMKSIKPDYVMGYTIKPVIYGSLAAALARVPHRFALVTGLGYAFQGAEEENYKKSNLQKLVHHLYSVALASTDKVFFQNPDDEALLRKMDILKPTTQTKVVNGSGVSLSEYAVVPFPSISSKPVVKFLLIARLLGDKGVREYAHAARIIKTKYSQVEFDLVGWLDDNPNSIQQSELDDWVNSGLFNFWGRLKDVKPAIADCSVYILPSYREGTPRSVLEAMAMGRPIITTDAPGCRETVIDGYNGFLVPVKAITELVDAMEKFLLDPELITRMGKASRQLIEDKFDVNKVNEAMLEGMGILK